MATKRPHPSNTQLDEHGALSEFPSHELAVVIDTSILRSWQASGVQLWSQSFKRAPEYVENGPGVNSHGM